MIDKFLYDLLKSSIVGAVTFFGSILLHGIGIYFLWDWFIAPVLAPITLYHATGITLLLGMIGFFHFPASKAIDQKSRNKEDWGRFFSEVAKVALYLLLGFGLKYIS